VGNYELTERGKIIIAVILALLVFVIPSTILVVLAWDRPPPPPDDPPVTAVPMPLPANDIPTNSDGPLPDGSGFSPDDNPENDINKQDSPDPLEDYPCNLPAYEPARVDLSKGTMVFLYWPDQQKVIDDEVLLIIGEFLTSPKNTDNSVILAEIPLLSDDDETTTLISAITDAFAGYGVPLRRLAFAVYQSDTDEPFFKVTLSFIEDMNLK